MPSLLFSHIPWTRLSEYRTWMFEQRINPEIYFSADALDTLDRPELEQLGRDLVLHDLSCTIHSPFMDLNPGSVDRAVRDLTAIRLGQVLDCAEILKARVVVVHPGYSRLTYGSAVEKWVSNTVEFWQRQQERVLRAGCKVALENIFEEEPSTLLMVLEQLDRSLFGHCLDTGHFNMFATVSFEAWFNSLGSFIVEAHLHDNHGQADEHLPVDEGVIDFKNVTSLLKQYAPQAIWTLEAHSRERLIRSTSNMAKYL